MSVGSYRCHSNQTKRHIIIILVIFKRHYLSNIPNQFGTDRSRGFGVVVLKCSRMDRRRDDGQNVITIDHSAHSLGELIIIIFKMNNINNDYNNNDVFI